MAKESFGKEINTKKLGGKWYRLYDIAHTKEEATREATRLRKEYSARIIPYHRRWLVYYRRR